MSMTSKSTEDTSRRQMSDRDKFREPLKIECDWCRKVKYCKNNAQVMHFRRCYPRGRTYSENGETVAASGFSNGQRSPDCVVLCATPCVAEAKYYLANKPYIDWLKDFNV